MRHVHNDRLRFPGLRRGCVGIWSPCLGPSGVTLYDWSAYKQHGTLVNAPVFDASGKHFSLKFNGSNTYVSLPRSVTNSRLNGKLHCAGSAWFRGSNVDSLFRLQPTGSQYIVLGNGGVLISHLDGGLTGVAIPAIVTNGSWHQVGFNRIADQSDGLQLFVDGVMVGSRSTVSTPLTFTGLNNGVNLGAYTNPTIFTPTNGAVAEWLLYDRPLTQAEMLLLARRPGVIHETVRRHRARRRILRSRQYLQPIGVGIY